MATIYLWHPVYFLLVMFLADSYYVLVCLSLVKNANMDQLNAYLFEAQNWLLVVEIGRKLIRQVDSDECCSLNRLEVLRSR